MAEAIVPGIVSNVAAKILEYLGKLAVEKISHYFGGRSKLNRLKNTMEMIQARLADAERRGEAENGEAVKVWLRRLKRVLYRLEDLLEEVDMADNQEEIVQRAPPPRGKLLLNCSCVPFSRWYSPLMINKLVADEAKIIMEELATIQSDMGGLNLVSLHSTERQLSVHHETNSRETYSFILEEEVIGRDDDKRAILDMIFHSNLDVREHVSVIPIVGIGGLGKTTLARLIFNDEKVQNHFELKAWACISNISSLRGLVRKILQSISGGGDYHQLSVEQLQTRLRQVVSDEKYLLVLDDIWDEDRQRWLDLRNLLCCGKLGSMIIVTSRSMVVARNMGTIEPYKLTGLSEERSWELFRSLAFKKGQDVRNPNLVSIGREIVKKCANVPLVVKTIACLLYSMDTEIEWESFKDKKLHMIEQNENSIMSTLKLSYDHLHAPLRQCFAYCSLFPKDYVFLKQDFTHLWMAQGFIGSLHGNQSPEDVGHGYFMQLLKRCFFQEFQREKGEELVLYVMHDLVHDLALHVSKGEVFLVDRPTQHTSDDILHVSFSVDSSWDTLSWMPVTKQIRSLLLPAGDGWYSDATTRIQNFGKLILSLRCVRVLDLAGGDHESLPDSIGELKHLRYLKLGEGFESLPESITRLQHLQTLNILCCSKLRELPSSFSNLISLRHLYIRQGNLIDLPRQFGRLTSLWELTEFIVGENNGLDALDSLRHLTGILSIRFVKRCGNIASKTKVEILKETNLSYLELEWLKESDGELTIDAEEEENELAYLECLQLPTSLKHLTFRSWRGVKFPNLGVPFLLSNLVYVEIDDCTKCKHLPPLNRLPRLRGLSLWGLQALEYVESSGGGNCEATSSRAPNFPSLEHLMLINLPKLKAWSRVEDQYTLLSWPLFPCLLQLEVQECPELISMPFMPKLEKLEANIVHGKLVKHLLCGDNRECSPPHTLRKLRLSSVHELDTLSVNLSSLQSLKLFWCGSLIKLILESPVSLRKLKIDLCKKLRDISGVLQNGSALEKLEIRRCGELDWVENNDEAEWKGLTSLRSLYLSGIPRLPRGLVCLPALQELTIDEIPNLRALPEKIGHLSELRQLHIWSCPELAALPKSICDLTALQQLKVMECPEVKRRCQEPDGEDWPLVQHIPDVQLKIHPPSP